MLRNREDKPCVAHCLAIGKRKADNNYPCHFHKTSTCTKEARKLHQLCKIAKKECGLGEIQKFANHAYFADYMINIYECKTAIKRVYSSNAVKDKMIIFLIFGAHCYPITSMAAFKNSSYWCSTCDASYSHSGGHKCKRASCSLCKKQTCLNHSKYINYQTCEVCYSRCLTEICLTAHKKLKTCKPKKLCSKCCKGVDPKLFNDKTQSHPNCGFQYC